MSPPMAKNKNPCRPGSNLPSLGSCNTSNQPSNSIPPMCGLNPKGNTLPTVGSSSSGLKANPLPDLPCGPEPSSRSKARNSNFNPSTSSGPSSSRNVGLGASQANPQSTLSAHERLLRFGKQRAIFEVNYNSAACNPGCADQAPNDDFEHKGTHSFLAELIFEGTADEIQIHHPAPIDFVKVSRSSALREIAGAIRAVTARDLIMSTPEHTQRYDNGWFDEENIEEFERGRRVTLRRVEQELTTRMSGGQPNDRMPFRPQHDIDYAFPRMGSRLYDSDDDYSDNSDDDGFYGGPFFDDYPRWKGFY